MVTVLDVEPGQLYCKPPLSGVGVDTCWGYFAKWCYKVGWLTHAETASVRYVLICMSDGMVHEPMSMSTVVEFLNKYDMVPAKAEWIHAMIDQIPFTLGLDLTRGIDPAGEVQSGEET